MADTGFLFPGTGANRPIASNTDWTDPTNCTADDGSDSSLVFAGFGASDGLAASNFDFSGVPDGSTIDGIEVRVGDYNETVGDIIWADCKLILADDTDGTEDKFASLIAPTTSDQTDEAGSASDLWSETINPSDVKDVDWGFFISVSTALISNMFIDFMQMKVYYTPISITDVDTDETWDDGDTGLVITGTGFV